MGNRRDRAKKTSRKLAQQQASQHPLAVTQAKAKTHYPCGKKRAEGPNEKVVAMRRVLLGRPDGKGHALQFGENALDLAKARGWLDEELHTAANDFAKLNARAGVEVAKLKTCQLERIEKAYSVSEGDPVAHAKLRLIWMRLQTTPGVMRQLVNVCLLGEWPMWLRDRITGEVGPDGKSRPNHEIERHLLVYGLKIVALVSAIQVSDDTRVMLREALEANALSCNTRRWLEAVA